MTPLRSALLLLLLVFGIGWLSSSPASAASWEPRPWGRERALQPDRTAGLRLQRIPGSSSGIAFTNVLPVERFTTNQIYLNGSGVALGDVDGDGLCDLFLAGLSGQSALYRNRDGWKFEDVTVASGSPAAGLDATGALLADIDGDGDLDLTVSSVGGGTIIHVNDGKGRFSRSTLLNPDRCGTSLAFADFDGDGSLDLYVANYRTVTLRDQPSTQFRILPVDGRLHVAAVNGRPTTAPDLEGRFTYTQAGGVLEHGEPDALYRNDGRGGWIEVTPESGVFLDEDGRPMTAKRFEWGLSVTFRDFTGDGLPDLYVCNDFDSPDRIWIHDGHGHFRLAPTAALRSTCKFSMGMDVADINRDGRDDLLVLDMLSRSHAVRLTRMDKGMEPTPPGFALYRTQVGRNTLQLGRPDGTFAEAAWFAGLAATEWSWTPMFLDVDLDGYEDLLVTAGHGRDDMDTDHGMALEAARRSRRLPPAEQLALRRGTPPMLSPRQAYRNVGGERFEEVGKEWGFGEEGVSHGMAAGDLDGDGDLDVVVNELNGAAGVYRNQASAGRVAVRLKGAGKNTRGIGARVTLRGGAVKEQSQEMMSGGRYLSGDEALRVFATGMASEGMELEVRWRSGKRSVVTGVKANREYEIDEATATAVASAPKVEVKPWFREVNVGHVHREDPYDDFARQALLPRKLSQAGPGVGWMDLDGDGWEDLVVGAGKGGSAGVYRNNGQGGFESKEMPLVARDQSGLAGLVGTDGKVRVLSGSSNYEDDSNTGGGVEEWGLGVEVEERVKGAWSSVGAVALGDVDGDGEVEVFVGSRVRAGRYPEADGSRIWKRAGTLWVPDVANTEVLKDAGMVKGAVWTDVDGDGAVDLVLATEWGPLKVYLNRKGRLEAVDVGLGKYRGYWNGVTSGDFDGDGRMDLVASNWGTNTRHRRERMYWGDLSGQGQVEMVEAEEEGGRWMPVRDLETVSRVLPWVREKYTSHRAYAEATMEGLLAGKKVEVVEVDWLETSVFLNRGGKFEWKRMPSEAQQAVGFGVSVGDADGDGQEDVFVAQNFFGVGAQESRSDGGRGLWLKGDGKGGFEAVDGSVSGVKVYGEGRGSALGDYDRDGRVDLVVGQAGGETKVYRNEGGRAGLRVVLEGRTGAYGAKVRLEYEGGKKGPARETHGGSGYWSQDGGVVVMGMEGVPKAVEVTWPGGKVTRSEVTAGVKEVRVKVAEGGGR